MTTRQQIGSMLWIAVFCAALTSPFWGSWLFGLGAILMAVSMEMRKDPLPTARTKSLVRAPKAAESD